MRNDISLRGQCARARFTTARTAKCIGMRPSARYVHRSDDPSIRRSIDPSILISGLSLYRKREFYMSMRKIRFIVVQCLKCLFFRCIDCEIFKLKFVLGIYTKSMRGKVDLSKTSNCRIIASQALTASVIHALTTKVVVCPQTGRHDHHRPRLVFVVYEKRRHYEFIEDRRERITDIVNVHRTWTHESKDHETCTTLRTYTNTWQVVRKVFSFTFFCS